MQALKVHDGYLIGNTGFNEFALRPCPSPSPPILSTNIGILLHHPFTHHRLAIEALQAVINYGIHTLSCQIIEADTDAINLPFRGLMRKMGLEKYERPGQLMDHDEKGLKGVETVEYSFGVGEWEGAVEGMREGGVWVLE